MSFFSCLSAASTWLSMTSTRAISASARAPSVASLALPASAAGAAAPRPKSAVTRGGRRGNLDPQRPAVELNAVELGDGVVRGLGRGDLDEPEAARLAGIAIGDDGDRLDALDLAEELAQSLRGGAECETTDEQLLSHDVVLRTPLGRPRALSPRKSAPRAWPDGEGVHDGPAARTRPQQGITSLAVPAVRSRAASP